ncbi:hypothetical protein M378DRAFT_28085 [Amanita muscaria Koide BX008]|uniref:Uncharacterized protein n=1 Tax=Amanita muscaria (strain Koide BX008) TaxID=946122 RepID=A0A0C2W7J5_AMAMK|nr:hypothetical protein M378DRAFT_28085 [Amanita muscaria Koide BX008]
MSGKSFMLQSLFALLFCTYFLSAQAFLIQHKVNVKDIHGKEHEIHYWEGSIHHSGQPTQKELVAAARSAMQSLQVLQEERPGAISALWAGKDTIYLASSLGGGAGSIPGSAEVVLGIDSRILQAFRDCTKALTNPAGRHRYGGKCAEIMVLQEWYRAQGHAPEKNLPNFPKLIASVSYTFTFIPPCAPREDQSGNRFGCSNVLDKLGFKDGEIVRIDPDPNWDQCTGTRRRRSFSGLTERGCVPKKPTAKPSPQGRPALKKPTAQAPRQGKPKPLPINKMPAKPKARSNRKPKPAPPRLPAKAR